MSTDVSGVQSFFGFLYHFVLAKLGTSRVRVKVEPYPIPGSFKKIKYLKTELNVDNGTYAIA